MLNKDRILERLFPPFLQELKDIEVFDTLSSTNDYLIAKAHTHPSGNWVCLAEHQSHGRGRQGRNWVSPFAKNLYFSILWRFSMDAGELSGLSLVTALALVKTLEQYQIQDLGVKWPNDVLWQYKKLAGILIKFNAEAHSTSNTVIGIGLNIDMPRNLDKHISQPWVDLEHIMNRPIDRNELVGHLLNQLIQAFFLFQTEGLTPFIQQWRERDLAYNCPVTVTTAAKELQGTGLGINDRGHLLVEMQNKEIHSFASGEVSLRMKPASKQC